MLGRDNADAIVAATAYDEAGEKIGSVGRLYLDDASGNPAWVSVSTGLFGNKESFVPLAGGSLDGDRLNVTVSREAVKNAPQVDLDDEHLGVEQAQELYRYYGIAEPGTGAPVTPPPPSPVTPAPSYDAPADGTSRADDRDDTGSRTDSDPANLDSDRTDSDRPDSDRPGVASSDPDVQETGQPGLRLRRHVIVEEQTITVPVVREEYVLEGEPELGEARDPNQST